MDSSFQNKQSSETEIHPFTSFGEINSNKKETFEAKIHDSDSSRGSLSAMDFHNQYGQHDDRPVRLPTLKPTKQVDYFEISLYAFLSL